MSALTTLIAGGGGGGGRVFTGLTTDVTFTGATTISCPSGKYLRIVQLIQINAPTSSTRWLRLTLAMGTRTIFSGELLADYGPYLNVGYGVNHGLAGVGVTNDGRTLLDHIDGKKDEDIVISSVTRNSTPSGLLVYSIMEDE